MSTTTLNNIEKLIVALPKKDVELGYKFLKERDFESLQSLVDSALIKVRKSRNTDNPKEEYKDINLETLETLKAEIDSYCMRLGIGEPDDDFVNNIDYING